MFVAHMGCELQYIICLLPCNWFVVALEKGWGNKASRQPNGKFLVQTKGLSGSLPYGIKTTIFRSVIQWWVFLFPVSFKARDAYSSSLAASRRGRINRKCQSHSSWIFTLNNRKQPKDSPCHSVVHNHGNVVAQPYHKARPPWTLMTLGNNMVFASPL